MTTATAPTLAPGPTVPANPGFRLKSGRIPDEYQWGRPDPDPTLTGWWIEGFDLGDFDEDWPTKIGSPYPGSGQITEEAAKAWAARFIERATDFQVRDWVFTVVGDPAAEEWEEWHEPKLTVTRHTLRIFQLNDNTDDCWVIRTLSASDVQTVIGKLSGPDAVIEVVTGDDDVVYVPVRAVASVRHIKATQDVA